jgi:hypothetical protein
VSAVPSRLTDNPCVANCIVKKPTCREDCAGHVMQKRPGQTGYKIETAEATKAWKKRQEAAKPQRRSTPTKRNKHPVTGQFLPGPVDHETVDISSMQGATPLEVLRRFFPHLADPSRAAWHVFLKAAFNEPLDDEERKVYESCTGRTEEFADAVRELWLICGRRAGKSEIVAFLAVYLAGFRKYHRTRNDKLIGMVLAADREQAGVIMNYISEMLHSHPSLEALIARRGTQFRETRQSITLVNGITIRVNTSNFRRVRGYTVCFVLCDEIAFWESEDAANPDHEVLKALRPALGTTRGMLICLSSPYWEKGELFKAHQRHFGRNDSKVLVWKAPTRVMNPTFPQEDVDAAYEEDHAAADAEYGANFRSDVQALFDSKVVADVLSEIAERPPVPGITYRAFVDPAGGSGQDSMTLAIAHSEKVTADANGSPAEMLGQVIEVLDCVREIKPPFNPDDTTRVFADVIRSYRLNSVKGDRYAGEWPRERFRSHGIEYAVSERTKNEIYKALLPLVNSRRVDMVTHKRMVVQMQNLERRTGRGGKDTIDHPKNQHDDIINAAAGALVSGESGGVKYRVRCVGGDQRSDGRTTEVDMRTAA